MSFPRISVVIPTCHRNDLLALCLDRLAPGAQTLAASQYEVIVSDDGSSSTAQGMMRENYPWARWTAGPRRGPAANRNHGVSQARGQWIAFTDDDCLPSSQWLTAFSEAIEPQTLVYEGKTTCEAGLKSPLEHAPINLSGGYLWSCNMLIEEDVFEKQGGFDERFPYAHMEDVDFRERLQSNNYHFKFIENAVVDHPPKRWPVGIRRILTEESFVFFWYKQGNKHSARNQIIRTFLRYIIRSLAKGSLSRDKVLALFSFLIEFPVLVANIGKWERRYKNSVSSKK